MRKPAFTEHHFWELRIFNSNEQSQSSTPLTFHNFTEKPAVSRKAICPHPSHRILEPQLCTPLPAWARSPHSHLLCGSPVPILVTGPHPLPLFAPGGCPFCLCPNLYVLRLHCDCMAALAPLSSSTWRQHHRQKTPLTSPLKGCHFAWASDFEAPVWGSHHHVTGDAHVMSFPRGSWNSLDWLLVFQTDRKHLPFPKWAVLSKGAQFCYYHTLCYLILYENCLSATPFLLCVIAVQWIWTSFIISISFC